MGGNNAGAGNMGGNAGQEDYGDKGSFLYNPWDLERRNLLPCRTSTRRIDINVEIIGLDFIEKKGGHTLSRDQNEKITDTARNFYEKQTG